MGRGQTETSWQKHQALREMQSTEVYLSGFNALCTFSHLLHEVKFIKKRSENEERQYKTQWDDGRQTNENITPKI